jgi:hypothetical protein
VTIQPSIVTQQEKEKYLKDKPLLIGISGKKQSGKDTLARMLYALMDNPPIQHFADALKEEVACACGTSWQDIERNKAIFRPILQWWGTDFRRKFQDEDNYWIDQLDSMIKYLHENGGHKVFLIPDVRFENEAKYVKDNNGILIRINREGLVSTDTHSSETALDNYPDFDIIISVSTLDQLKEKAKEILNELIKPRQNRGTEKDIL